MSNGLSLPLWCGLRGWLSIWVQYIQSSNFSSYCYLSMSNSSWNCLNLHILLPCLLVLCFPMNNWSKFITLLLHKRKYNICNHKHCQSGEKMTKNHLPLSNLPEFGGKMSVDRLCKNSCYWLTLRGLSQSDQLLQW